MSTFYYNSLEEKEKEIIKQQKKGFSVKHDTFKDVNNNKTKGQKGQLIFTNKVPKHQLPQMTQTQFIKHLAKQNNIDLV